MAIAPKQGLRRPTIAATAGVPAPAAPSPAAPPPEAPAVLVKVECLVTTGPWTHNRRLDMGDVAEMPVALAELMAQRGQVKVL